MSHKLSRNGSRILFVLLACTLVVSLMVLGGCAGGKSAETPAEIWYSPASFSPYATEGGANLSETLRIRNYGGGTLHWTVSDDAAWLTLNPTSGTSTGQMDEASLLVDITGMSAGSYSATITIEAPEATNTPQTVPVSLTIVAPGPPSLTITSFSVSPVEVDPGELVTITVGVENTGATKGSRTIELWVEGAVEDSQHVTLDPGATENITFTVSREQPGIYRVAVDGFRGEFEVVLLRDPVGYPEVMKLYITPDDPEIEDVVNDILSGPLSVVYDDFDAMRDWVASHVSAMSDESAHGTSEYWQLPTETLSLGTGDCEDFAILLCTLLRAYGVPADQVYVGLGLYEDGSGHAFLFERWYKGIWRAIEPQYGALLPLLLGEIDITGYDDFCCFNDQEYFSGMPALRPGVYEFEVDYSFWPATRGATVEFERYLNAGEEVTGWVQWLGSSGIIYDWSFTAYDPHGNTVLDWSGTNLRHDFSFTAYQAGVHKIEVLKRDYLARCARMEIQPPDWTQR